jgi:hypothetical protein
MLPMVTLKISPYTNVTLTLGWTTLFVRVWVTAPYMKKKGTVKHRELKSGHGPHRKPTTKTNWLTDRRLQYNLNLIRGRMNKIKGTQYLGQPLPGGYKYGDMALQVGGVSDETLSLNMSSVRLGPLSDCTANYRPVLSSEREPYMKKKEAVKHKKTKSSERGARYQDELAD